MQARGVYEIGSYGWLNEDEPDPASLGHAMWQHDSLSTKYALATEASHLPELEDWQKFLMISGSDLEGLMEAARLSIGLLLLHYETVKQAFLSLDPFFQLQLISSVMILGSASDRIRDVFVAAAFHMDTDKYKSDGSISQTDRKKRSLYARPFDEIARQLVEPHSTLPVEDIIKSTEELKSLAPRVQAFRKLRNHVVHTVASEMGKTEREILNRSAADTTTMRRWSDPNSSRWREEGERAEKTFREGRENDVNQVVDWYKLLIEFSNNVFVV